MSNSPETYNKVFAINVDIQNDFARPDGALSVPNGEEVIEPMNRVNRWVRENNGNVIFTRDWHPKETPHFDKWPPHCIQHRAGAAFPDELEIGEHDKIASKGMYKSDGYSGWNALLPTSPGYLRDAPDSVGGVVLDRSRNPFKKERDRVAVVIGGLATDYCVKATALDALESAKKYLKDERYKGGSALGMFVLRDAVRAVDLNPGDGEQALQEMEKAGAHIVTSQEIIDGKAFLLEPPYLGDNFVRTK